MRRTTFNFNKEILLGECGALLLANLAAPVAAHFTTDPSIIAWVAVGATLSGGALFWLLTRIYDQRKYAQLSARTMARDIGYFTPAAVTFSALVYNPALYFLSEHLLQRGSGVSVAVLIAQVTAFSLFLACLNLYRLALFKFWGKSL